jgi:uncharacterized protein involved in exopolysaccharide biosynthesis
MQDRAALSDRSAPEVRELPESFRASIAGYPNISGFVQRHFRTIAASVAAAVAVAILLLFLAEPIFTAQSQILIDPGIQSVLHDQSDDPPAAMDSQQLETQIAVLRSEEVSKAVVQTFNLTQDPEFRAVYATDYLFPWHLSPASIARSDDEQFQLVLAKFRKNLIVRRIGVSYAIDIYFTSRDPEKAARIANAIAEAYMRFQLDVRANAARVGSQWLGARLSELRHDMNAASRKMQEYRAAQNYSIRTSAPAKPVTMTSASDPSQPNGGATHDEPLTLEELESTASTYRRAYESVLQSFMTAVQRQSFPIANARIITNATPPLTQSRQTGLLVLLAAMMGILAGTLVGYLRDRSNIRKPALTLN